MSLQPLLNVRNIEIYLKIMKIIAGIMKISLHAINRNILLWFVVNFPKRFLSTCTEFGPICWIEKKRKRYLYIEGNALNDVLNREDLMLNHNFVLKIIQSITP